MIVDHTSTLRYTVRDMHQEYKCSCFTKNGEDLSFDQFFKIHIRLIPNFIEHFYPTFNIVLLVISKIMESF